MNWNEIAGIFVGHSHGIRSHRGEWWSVHSAEVIEYFTQFLLTFPWRMNCSLSLTIFLSLFFCRFLLVCPPRGIDWQTYGQEQWKIVTMMYKIKGTFTEKRKATTKQDCEFSMDTIIIVIHAA